MMRNRHVTCVGHVTWVGVALHEPVASSSRSQLPGQAARAVACLTSGVVSTVVHQRPWLVVVEVTHLVTRHQPDQPVAGRCHGRGCSSGRRRSALAKAARSRVCRP
jgi:hypothetical protein